MFDICCCSFPNSHDISHSYPLSLVIAPFTVLLGETFLEAHGLIYESCFEIEKMSNVQNSVISPWACLRGNRVMIN